MVSVLSVMRITFITHHKVAEEQSELAVTSNGSFITINDKEMPCIAVIAMSVTRSQAVAGIADRTSSQHFWGSRDVIGHMAIW